MPLPLNVNERHNRDKMPDVKTIRSRIKPDIAERGLRKISSELIGFRGLSHKPSFIQYIEDILRLWHSFPPEFIGSVNKKACRSQSFEHPHPLSAAHA
jgi:hypothetical protein